MKRFFCFLVLLAAAALVALVYCAWRRGASSHDGLSQAGATDSEAPALGQPADPGKPALAAPSLAGRNRMPLADHLRWLEEHGEVPQDADLFECRLAQKTGWYGKPLDPKTFWRGRVVWLDKAAQTAAKRHGRLYPPPPHDNAGTPEYGAADSPAPFSQEGGGGPDSTGVDYRWTSSERAFWDHFAKTLPRPPDDLEREQLAVAELVLGPGPGQSPSGRSPGIPVRTSQELLAASGQRLKAQAIGRGYPAEAFSEEALFWCYVLARRQEIESGPRELFGSNSAAVATFLQGVVVDSNLITGPLNVQQVQAANAWKIAYLQRLQKENTDESYINAYLQAWNLSAAEVFGGTNGP
jgi:hypothetical protein